MNYPRFFFENAGGSKDQLTLDEETSKHVVQVLRMKPGDLLQLTDGKGILITAEIVNDHKKRCEVKVHTSAANDLPVRKLCIALSILKSASRFEWFLEKATEIGINEIIPLLCERTERQHFRYERMKTICISAMLQSKQVWMPALHEPVAYTTLLESIKYQQKLIAHCLETDKQHISRIATSDTCILLIGPEGDFTLDEIELAQKNLFIPVSLGNTRLRTETAGIVGAAFLANR